MGHKISVFVNYWIRHHERWPWKLWNTIINSSLWKIRMIYGAFIKNNALNVIKLMTWQGSKMHLDAVLAEFVHSFPLCQISLQILRNCVFTKFLPLWCYKYSTFNGTKKHWNWLAATCVLGMLGESLTKCLNMKEKKQV